jgi:hypothetical protein
VLKIGYIAQMRIEASHDLDDVFGNFVALFTVWDYHAWSMSFARGGRIRE